MKKRILTGDRPTGRLHIGHLVGSLKQRVQLQDEYEQFILIADTQALTDNFDDPQKVQKNVMELMLDYLAVGIDPDKSTIFIQSMIPAIHELFLYVANLVTIEQLKHNPTLKSELAEKKESKTSFKSSTPLGFFIYPAHQVADIICVNADLVPVGEDQLPMVEMTRSFVRKFNALYKSTFLKQPKARVSDFPRLVGTDGNGKMSKSLGNCIYISDESDVLRTKVMSMYTDPNRIRATDPGKVDGNPVFIYHDAFNPNLDEVNDLKERYKKGTIGDVEVKQKLFIAMDEMLTPIRERRKKYESNMKEVRDILMSGTEKTKKVAEFTLEQVKNAVGIKY